jgi:hypothetical protein
MRRIFVLIIVSCSIMHSVFSQEKESAGAGLRFHGIVMEAGTSMPLPGTQIMINHNFSGVSNDDGTFSMHVEKNDTVMFSHLGFKPTLWNVSDTLKGNDFVAGIYLHSDTISIGEVIIFPRIINLKSQILNSPSKVPSIMENAKYNVAISAYQGKTTTGKLGDAQSNYNVIHSRQSTSAYEKGQIPSSAIAGFSPLLIIPAAYLLIHGLPEKPESFENMPTEKELEQIRNEYFRLQQQK